MSKLVKQGVQRRSQESFSLIISLIIALTLFIIFSTIITGNTNTALNIQTLTQMRTINEQLSRAIYRSFINGPGSNELIYLEEISEDYEISIVPSNVVINYDYGSNTNPTYAKKVFENTVSSGEVLIQNQGGWINVTQVTS